MKDNDLKWFANTNLSKHKGEYVIILNQKIVTHGKNLKKILDEFRKKYPENIPKVAKIPEESLLVNTTIKAKIAWALTEEVPYLLGRIDIFDKFNIYFKQKERKIIFDLV